MLRCHRVSIARTISKDHSAIIVSIKELKLLGADGEGIMTF
jgi:hypothetical protein